MHKISANHIYSYSVLLLQKMDNSHNAFFLFRRYSMDYFTLYPLLIFSPPLRPVYSGSPVQIMRLDCSYFPPQLFRQQFSFIYFRSTEFASHFLPILRVFACWLIFDQSKCFHCHTLRPVFAQITWRTLVQFPCGLWTQPANQDRDLTQVKPKHT